MCFSAFFVREKERLDAERRWGVGDEADSAGDDYEDDEEAGGTEAGLAGRLAAASRSSLYLTLQATNTTFSYSELTPFT